MIDYEIEAILKVVDRASPDLRRVIGLSREAAASMERLDQVEMRGISALSLSGLEKNLRAISRAIPVIEKHLGGLGVAFDGAFGAAAGKIDAVAVSVERLNAGLTGIKSAALAASGAMPRPVPVGRSGRGGSGGRRGGGGFHISGHQEIGGGFGAGYGATPGMIGALGLGYGLYQEAELEDTISNILFTSGVSMGKRSDADRAAIRKIIQDTASATGSPIAELNKASLGIARMMAGFPVNDRISVLKTGLEFGAQEHRLKGVSYEEGAESIIGLMHQVGHYDPKSLNSLASHVAYLSLVTPASLGQFTRATSYSLPLIQQGAKLDVDELLLTQAAMQRSGVLNTKSGTWVRQAILGLLLGSSTQSKQSAKSQQEGLKKLGLIDAHGKSLVWGQDGNFKLATVAGKINEARARLSTPNLLLAEKQAFGTQGMAGISAISNPAMQAQMPQLMAEMAKVPEAKQYFADLFENSPAQKARKSIADMTNALTDIAKILTPTFSATLSSIDKSLLYIDSVIQKIPGTPAVNQNPIFKPFEKTNRNSHTLAPGQPIPAPSVWDAFRAWWDHKEAPAKKSSFVPTNTQDAQAQKVSLNMDGRKVGEIVLARMAGTMSGPQSGYSGFDGRMQPVPVVASYAI